MSNGTWEISMKKLGGQRSGCTIIKLLPYLYASFIEFLEEVEIWILHLEAIIFLIADKPLNLRFLFCKEIYFWIVTWIGNVGLSRLLQNMKWY